MREHDFAIAKYFKESDKPAGVVDSHNVTATTNDDGSVKVSGTVVIRHRDTNFKTVKQIDFIYRINSNNDIEIV